MNQPVKAAEQRKHPRAQLKLPVRVRWRGPLGMRLESTHTVDVAREGISLHRTEPCEVHSCVWLAMPYNSKLASVVQPEIPARVVRVEKVSDGGFHVALRLPSTARISARPMGRERRAFPRTASALPIFVREGGSAWPEECMTQNIARGGARLETIHKHASGDTVFVKIPWGEWEQAGEIPARVMRVIPAEASPSADTQSESSASGTKAGALNTIAIHWDGPAKSSKRAAAPQFMPRKALR
jgi:hypothetical protein